MPAAPAPAPTPSAAAAAPSASAATVAYEIPKAPTKLFNERCAHYHGKGGEGDGVGRRA